MPLNKETKPNLKGSGAVRCFLLQNQHDVISIRNMKYVLKCKEFAMDFKNV